MARGIRCLEIRDTLRVIENAVVAGRPGRQFEILQLAGKPVAMQRHVKNVGGRIIHRDSKGHRALRDRESRTDQKKTGEAEGRIHRFIGYLCSLGMRGLSSSSGTGKYGQRLA